ncbi:hypothetical protein WDW37_12760 [Bdellovibrionota bacterium FG-1]
MPSNHLFGHLIESLPKQFSFYHLGEVRLTPSVSVPSDETTLPKNPVAVAFSVEGDVRGSMLLLFEEGLDVSVYSEMGNVIASQMVTSLAEKEGVDLYISPPKILSSVQLSTILKNQHGVARTYLHQPPNAPSILLQALVIPTETHGYA